MAGFLFGVEVMPDFPFDACKTGEGRDKQSAHLYKVRGGYPLGFRGYGEANRYEQVDGCESQYELGGMNYAACLVSFRF